VTIYPWYFVVRIIMWTVQYTHINIILNRYRIETRRYTITRSVVHVAATDSCSIAVPLNSAMCHANKAYTHTYKITRIYIYIWLLCVNVYTARPATETTGLLFARVYINWLCAIICDIRVYLYNIYNIYSSCTCIYIYILYVDMRLCPGLLDGVAAVICWTVYRTGEDTQNMNLNTCECHR